VKGFKFSIGSLVALRESGEQGRVIGRAEYEHCENAYYLRYKAADGRQVEQWWSESSIA
jgi:hypothetical protein